MSLWPVETPPSEIQQIVWHMGIFGNAALRAIDQLLDNAGLLWSEGRMVGVSLPIRMSLEIWGAAVFGRNILQTFIADGDIERIWNATARLTVGARTPVMLPHGVMSDAPAYSVMNFIDALERETPKARATYEFLCEACHPNMIQNFYFLMASKTYDNFSNETFKAHAHELLEKTASAIEMITSGFVNTSKEIAQACDAALAREPQPQLQN
jgi:hypothetical protein